MTSTFLLQTEPMLIRSQSASFRLRGYCITKALHLFCSWLHDHTADPTRRKKNFAFAGFLVKRNPLKTRK